jgi:hypothetical protein
MTWESESKKVGRRYVKYFEVDADYCTRSFGVSPCLPAGAFSTDTFTGANDTQLADHNEIGSYIYVDGPDSGSPKLRDNYLYTGNTDGRQWIARLDREISSADHEISCDVTFVGSPATAKFILRSDESYANCYYIEVDAAGSKVDIYSRTAGALSLIASISFTIVSVVKYSFSASIIGENLIVSMDDTELLNTTDAAVSSGGYVGIGAYAAAFTGVWLDNFRPKLYAATGSACFNTRATCQYSQAYSTEAKTYRFFESTEDAYALGLDGYPLLVKDSINIQPAEIQPGKGIGYRASVDIKFKDQRHHDRGTDPYVASRSYDPMEQGTFWGKWLARNQYYTDREVKVFDGFLDETGYNPDNFRSRRYIIEKIDGPRRNIVTFQCKDILRKLGTSIAPPVSNTYLSAAIDSTQTTIPLNTNGDVSLLVYTSDGEAHYIEPFAGTIPFYTSGVVSSFIPLTTGLELPFYKSGGTPSDIKLIAAEFPVGEVVAFRVEDEIILGTMGVNEVTGATRGYRGSLADSHAIDLLAQNCIDFDSVLPTDALRTLFSYAGITETDIDTAGWDEQADKWLGLTRIDGIISEPTKVVDSVERVAEQGTCYPWFDDILQKVKLLAVAPQGSIDLLPTYTDELNFLENSTSSKQDMREQVTQAWVFYDKNDATGDNSASNMLAPPYIAADFSAEGAEQYNRSFVKEFFCEFVKSQGHASSIASRTVGRLRNGKQIFEFNLDVKDSTLSTGDEFVPLSDAQQDATGAQERVRMQVVRVKELKDGVYQYKATKSAFQASRYAFIMPDTASDPYSISTQEERDTGFYISNNLGYMDDGSEAYKFI